MKKRADIMGMPVSIEIIDPFVKEGDIDAVFGYLREVDGKFSTYKTRSEISQINRGEVLKNDYSEEMKKIFALAEKTKQETHEFFDIQTPIGIIDPSGIVKGYAISQSVKHLKEKGYENFFIEIAGDIEVAGKNKENKPWRVGIENPFSRKEIIKVVVLTNKGIATSGNYIRGQHIYNPKGKTIPDDITSISVIGPTAYDADRFATAAFAMGEKGIAFIEALIGYEGYMIKKDKTAVLTSGFEKFVL